MQTGSSYRSVQPFVVRIVRGFGDHAGGIACSENLDFELGSDIAVARILSWGQDMDAETLPFQCNPGYPVPRTKAADYVGETRLEEVRALVEAGRPPIELTLVSLVLGGRPIGDYAPGFWLISASDGVEPIGYVTSPSYSPELETNIAMGCVPCALSALGTRVKVWLPAEYATTAGPTGRRHGRADAFPAVR